MGINIAIIIFVMISGFCIGWTAADIYIIIRGKR